ncbi:MAG: RNA methyltransferase [Candidatus Diapherotrites archaeon]
MVFLALRFGLKSGFCTPTNKILTLAKPLMQAIVVLVGCEYEENLGLVARAMKNFGLKKLVLVSPKADKESEKALSRAMHAREILKRAKIFESLEKALALADVSVATTSKTSKSPGCKRKAVSPEFLAEKYSGTKAKIALVFGRESIGLSNSEIEKCDFVVSIPASKKNPVLNVSHAAAIVFYELFRKKPKKLFYVAGRRTRIATISVFSELAESTGKIRDLKAVVNSFKHVVSRSPATEKELRAIIAVLSESLKKIKK